MVTGRKADKAGHSDIERIVPFEIFLAAQRMDNRSCKSIGKCHDLVMRASASAAAKKCDRVRTFKDFDEPVDIGRRRNRDRREGRKRAEHRAVRCLHQRNIAGQHNDGDALLANRGADRNLQNAREMVWVGNEFGIVAALAEQFLRVGLLKIAKSNLG